MVLILLISRVKQNCSAKVNKTQFSLPVLLFGSKLFVCFRIMNSKWNALGDTSTACSLYYRLHHTMGGREKERKYILSRPPNKR